MITIVPHRSAWRDEFLKLGRDVRQALGDHALRIDHIGSTAVPGLAAKDIIDIQVTASAFDPLIQHALERLKYRRLEHIVRDHVPPGCLGTDEDWAKWFFKGDSDQRPTNLHVRIAERPNQRYPLLFRDYLRSHESAAQAYGQIKLALSRLHPTDIDAYYDVKDPVCDVIMGGAEGWATQVGWKVVPSDC